MKTSDLFPTLDWQLFVVAPWAEDFRATFVVVLMGFLVCLGCGLAGVYVILRRMALVGDAISHSILPGVFLMFLVTGTWNSLPMMAGAVATGILSVLLIELIHKTTRVKPDAAIGIVFTSLFAIGVVLISTLGGEVHFDAECVLYGEIGYVALEPPVEFFGCEWLPVSVLRMAVVSGLTLGLILLFYKQLLVTSFDPGLAASLGMRTGFYHYGLTCLLALLIVSALEAVGVILVIAMIIFPGATGLLLSRRLSGVLVWSAVFALLYALLGFHLAQWLNSSLAGSMTVVALVLFVLVWGGSVAMRGRQRS